MAISDDLQAWLQSGVHRIGEIEMLTNLDSYPYALCHWQDADLAREPGFGGLEVSASPDAARGISNHDADGAYRFAKGQTNLRRGWLLVLGDLASLRLALDLFYPAALGLYRALKLGTLEVEHLRDKLNRQTGMYRHARNISDAGAQELVTEMCGPAHQCAKRILWQLDPDTPLADSEASRFDGISTPVPAQQAIPLLCREACNHFVAQCRIRAKREFDSLT
jgi:sirohydrochlorin cobaltochelatase